MSNTKTEIRFYHLKFKPLDQALPEILEKALEKGHRIVVKHPDEKRIKQLNDAIWTFRTDSFIPHGTKAEGFAEDQPVWLTTEDENPNTADVLIVTGGAEPKDEENYTLCCEILEDSQPEALQSSRARWKDYKDKGYDVTYWQQGEQGQWLKKA